MVTPEATLHNIKDISDLELISSAISGREDGFEGSCAGINGR
jgi:hypothetical protein